MAEDGKCRKSGLELLRIIAVILIVAHHEVAHSDINVFDQTFCVKRLFFDNARILAHFRIPALT